MALCIVSFVDWSGIRHSVEVEADGLFEAVVLAVKTFKQHDCDPGDATLIEVEVRSSVTHTITLRRVTDWLNGACRSPKEKIKKEALKEMLLDACPKT